MRRLIFGHLVYLWTPIGLLAALAGVLAGGQWVWLGMGIFALNIVLDTVTKNIHTQGAATTKEGEPAGLGFLHNLVMYLMLPVFMALLVALAWRVFQYTSGVPVETQTFAALGWSFEYTNGITGAQLMVATISVALHQGLGIIYGHELAHTKGPSFVISRWIMAMSGAAHFCFAHVYNHHLELGRAWMGPEGNKMSDGDVDPATAPRGRSLYKHFLVSHIGQSYFGILTERKRLKRQGKSFFSLSNRWIRGYLMSVPVVALFAGAGYLGAGVEGLLLGLAAMLVVWVISNFELEALNYMEHYGLIRVKGDPIEYRHSWDNDGAFTSWAFIEIGRQADHHDRGETHYWELSSVGGSPEGAPNTGFGYYTEFVLALLPPLWHRVMKKKLAIWDRDFASPEEQKIAREINRKVGYDVDPSEIQGRTMDVNYAL